MLCDTRDPRSSHNPPSRRRACVGLLQHLAQDAGRVGEAAREPAGDELVERGGETRCDETSATTVAMIVALANAMPMPLGRKRAKSPAKMIDE